MSYIVHRLPLVEGGQVTPYAITLKGKKSPIVHINHHGCVKKEEDESILVDVIQTQESSDLDFLVREYCPENTKVEHIRFMLHGD